jgi:hypothetical protein
MGVSGDDMGSSKRNCRGRPRPRPSGITTTAMRQIASESDVIIEDTSLALARRRHHAGRRSWATTAKLVECVRSGAVSDRGSNPQNMRSDVVIPDHGWVFWR